MACWRRFHNVKFAAFHSHTNRAHNVEEKTARSSIQVIDRMMSLLEALARHPAPVSLKQLAAETSLHPSTAHRILNVMVGNRMVDRVEPGTYQLGMRLLELGSLVRLRTGMREEPLPLAQELRPQIGETMKPTGSA
jgi:IclR family KDG regulon transcriptional repressor